MAELVEAFQPRREERWYHCDDLIRHVEEHNCSLGCKRATPNAAEEYGPGGQCTLLALACIEEPIPEWWDDGAVVHCRAREPVTPDGKSSE